MGGKSRKTGGVSKSLIEELKYGKKGGGSSCGSSKPKSGGFGILDGKKKS